jgi:hypothetical protein
MRAAGYEEALRRSRGYLPAAVMELSGISSVPARLDELA